MSRSSRISTAGGCATSARSAGVAKQELYANAAALLMPIRWREPFGMVMVEALACGTPVIAFPEGAAAEIVIDGENGMLVGDEAEMARAVARLGSIDPRRCRASVAERYDPAVTAAGYERVYRQAIAANRGAQTSADSSRVLPAHGSALTTAGEHWKRARSGDDETELAVSRTGVGRASRVELGRSWPRARDDGA